MSKAKPVPAAQKLPPRKVTVNEQKGFAIPYPLLWLAGAAFVVYFPTLFYKLTELDDSIFIRDFHDYNEQLGNLLTSFNRGLFEAIKDPYYRPLFMDSMILNYQVSGGGENIASYHFFNIVFHIISVVLLYKLFIKLEVNKVNSFILTLIFAVHPVLSQAVAWIPGRNDTMLAIFTLSFLIYSVDYSKDSKPRSLILSGLFLLLAFFTKETAVFVAPVAFVMVVYILKKNWRDPANVKQYLLWAAIFIFWFVARYFAVPHADYLAPGQIAIDFLHRLPIIVQYIGKIFLPVNLSVFPIQEDASYLYGVIAIILLAAALYYSKTRAMRMVWGGVAVFLLFLLPALFVPNNLNEQIFEHRLYLPIIGILLLLPQTVFLRNKFDDKQLFIGGVAVSCVLALLNFQHQRSFSDPKTFWEQAVATSPHSAFANMMLGAREDDMQQSYALFRRAYQLNPREKYLNFYYGVMLQKEDSVKESEKYLLTEKNSSGYYECDFYLARVAMERKDFNSAITDLQTYLTKDVHNKMANSNLLLLYLDTNQRDKAIIQAKHMQQIGLAVPQALLTQLGI